MSGDEPGAAVGSATSSQEPLVLVLGNPNTGKTTLFNALAGTTERVGNYPGITVERRTAKLTLQGVAPQTVTAEIVDLPGAYSLSARSPEEQIALCSVLGLNEERSPSLALVVVDAGQLSRNLYLVVQLLELDVPLVIALNMIDEVRDQPPDAARLAQALGVPVVPTCGRDGQGLEPLRQAIAEALDHPPRRRPPIEYSAALLKDAAELVALLPERWRSGIAPQRALGLWALSSLGDDELSDVPENLRRRCRAIRERDPSRDLDLEIVEPRYAFIDRVSRSAWGLERVPSGLTRSERFDRFALHPWLGPLMFLVTMLLLFQALFAGSSPFIGAIESVMVAIQSWLVAVLPSGWTRDLVAEGVVGGVGNVVVFLPQIMLLFLFIGVLEDSGYMSRVAFLVDRLMQVLGLHGRAFLPILSGFACAVPAILSTRTLERRRDRLLTMLVIPLGTCSARLPVYTLIIGALFPDTHLWGWFPVQGALLVGMYALSLLMTLSAALVLGKTVVPGKRVPLILELPPYRVPSLRTTLRMVAERAGTFLREAGTIILLSTVALWFLLSFPRSAPPPPLPARTEIVHPAHSASVNAESSSLEGSYGARLGKALEPVLRPLGFDWKIGVGLVGAFTAREAFVSTLALVYGKNDGSNPLPLREHMRRDRGPDGKPRYSPRVGASLLVFFAIACQCVSTLSVVRRETKSWRWPLFLFAYTGVLAWVISFLVYQGGGWFGFG